MINLVVCFIDCNLITCDFVAGGSISGFGCWVFSYWIIYLIPSNLTFKINIQWLIIWLLDCLSIDGLSMIIYSIASLFGDFFITELVAFYSVIGLYI